MPTVARAEAAKEDIPAMGTDAMAKIVLALEAAGVEFQLEPETSLVGGLSMRMRTQAASGRLRLGAHGNG